MDNITNVCAKLGDIMELDWDSVFPLEAQTWFTAKWWVRFHLIVLFGKRPFGEWVFGYWQRPRS